MFQIELKTNVSYYWFSENYSATVLNHLLKGDQHCCLKISYSIASNPKLWSFLAPGPRWITAHQGRWNLPRPWGLVTLSLCVSNVGPIYWILNHGLSMVIFPSPLNLQLPIWNQEFSSWTRELVGSTNVKVKTSNGPTFQHFGHTYSDLNKPF